MNLKKKILIVDDEEDVLAYLEAVFKDNGYDTILAQNGILGYELAKTEKPDLITLDITMPDQTGVRTYHQYKEDNELKHIPVIIITATDDSAESFQKRIGGLKSPEDFINKPVSVKDLLQKVETIFMNK